VATKKKAPKQTYTGFQPPLPSGPEGYAAASELRGEFVHNQEDIIERWNQLKTPEAMAVFAERWVSLTASQFERTWPVLYQMLKFIKDHKLYEDATKMSDRKTYESFQGYFEAKVRQQFSVWSDMEVDYHFARDQYPELLAKVFSDAHEAIRKLLGRGGDRKSKIFQEDNENQTDNISLKYGTQSEYLKARLAKHHKTIFEQFKAGKYKSVRAAAIAAGIIEPQTPVQQVQAGWKRATLDDKKKIIIWIQDRLQNDPDLLESLG
jgi:hypothetical protein